MFHDLFLKHPQTVGESYTHHFATAWEFGLRLIAAGCACVIHACVPRFFEHTASNAVKSLHARMMARRQAQVAPHPEIDYAI